MSGNVVCSHVGKMTKFRVISTTIRQYTRRSAAVLPRVLALLILGTIGCSTYHYEITLRPDGNTIERELTCWRESTYQGRPHLASFPPEELAKIAAAYGAEPSTKLDQKHSFKGRFTGTMPVDLDNNGTYTHWTSPFGTTSVYMERFGGNDNVVGQIEERRKASDRLVDLLIAWLETELGKEPNWESLRNDLDTRVRHDLLNLSYTILLGYDPGMSAENYDSKERFGREEGSLLARVSHYLVEHGYFTFGELPKLFGPNIESALLQWGDRFIGQRLGLADDAPRPPAMDFLESSKSVEASLNQFVRTTPEYQKLLEQWRTQQFTNAAAMGIALNLEEVERVPDSELPDWMAPRPTADNVIGELIRPMLKLNWANPKKLNVVLDCGEPPIATNGVWDEDKQAVTWIRERNEGQGLPTHIYATWSRPNRSAQEERFGKVTLTAEKLGQYVLWYVGLTKAQAAEWDDFIAKLHPGPDLIPTIEAFRFSHDPPLPADSGEPKPPSDADRPRALLLEALNAL